MNTSTLESICCLVCCLSLGPPKCLVPLAWDFIFLRGYQPFHLVKGVGKGPKAYSIHNSPAESQESGRKEPWGREHRTSQLISPICSHPTRYLKLLSPLGEVGWEEVIDLPWSFGKTKWKNYCQSHSVAFCSVCSSPGRPFALPWYYL